MSPSKREKPIMIAKAAWKKVLETLLPQRKKVQKTQELGKSNTKYKQREAGHHSSTTLSTYTDTLRENENGVGQGGNTTPVWRHGEDVGHAKTVRFIEEEEIITALPPMPPRPVIEAPVVQAPGKLRKKRTMETAGNDVQRSD
ncbi:hypothetical protein N0V83_009419 [Neocucurbitaria cava]|uniref:Uncharacterized protein n=1 Tax=Neocucurbitaria cava TaxID=798079 RepID=A0A9W8XZH9_9PLEO|nr:hypothetical protein N0V83_009419 [Neocucurbitaria cava]